jgi:hypothetical protein
MPQLESLAISFTIPIPNREVERQLTHNPITTHITLPNLRVFWFQGVNAYLEAVVCRITTLASKTCGSNSSSNPRFPFHVSRSL